MSSFTPPSGPPPPKVPEGWKAVWNDQYKEWFYVNLHTKESTWEKPTEPAPRPGQSSADDAPPSYSTGPNDPPVSDAKRPLESNNPLGKPPKNETDEQMARRLQDEENQRTGTRGESDSYYNSDPGPPAPDNRGASAGPPSSTSPMPPDSGKSKGFLGKLLGKNSNSQPGYPQQGGYPPRPYQQPYPPQGYPPQGYGGYPPQGYGGYPPQGYGGYPPQGYGYAQQQQQPPRRSGMGAGGAAALGLGGGLLGGALLAHAIDDGQQNAYQDGYQDGADGGGGGDYGGGDYGGGGGDFGGGDFGGGGDF